MLLIYQILAKTQERQTGQSIGFVIRCKVNVYTFKNLPIQKKGRGAK